MIEFLIINVEVLAIEEAVRIHFKLGPDDPLPSPDTATKSDFEAIRAITAGLLTEPSATAH